MAQLCSDFNSQYAEVNKQLDKMGYNIGMRLIEDFFAKSGLQRCGNFRETAETISKVCSSRKPQLWQRRYPDATNVVTDRIQDVLEHYTSRDQLVGG